MAIRIILVPTDLSAHSREAFEHAIELAKTLSAKLVLLHAYWVSLPMPILDVWTVLPRLAERLREGARVEIEPLQRRAAQVGVSCELRLCASSPVPAILEVAESLPADLIVMGTHGLTGVKHAALGSVAERIVRLAPCPVLTVKESTEDEHFPAAG